jgi:hypothetical protein
MTRQSIFFAKSSCEERWITRNRVYLISESLVRKSDKSDLRGQARGDACGEMNQISWKTLQRLIADY